jgi:acyl-CoA synthetase (AMP-forming)/AMP-acid ligase II
MNLSALLSQTAALFPDRPGLIQGERQWTWREIDARVDALVQGLRSLGMRPGDKLLVMSRNNPALFESCWAAFRLGAVWVPVNFRLTPPEVAYLGSASEASVMLAEDCFAEHVAAVKAASSHLRSVVTIGLPRAGGHGYEPLLAANAGAPAAMAQVDGDHPLWYFYTSGTTGRPKAAVLTHGQLAFVVTNHLADLIPGTTEHDCFTIAELLEYEAMGLAPHGQGARVILDGVSRKDGKLPVNPSGGLKSRGHPIGATGVSQHVMAAMQLAGLAGDMQVGSGKPGAVFNMGGAAVANYLSVLEVHP